MFCRLRMAAFSYWIAISLVQDRQVIEGIDFLVTKNDNYHPIYHVTHNQTLYIVLDAQLYDQIKVYIREEIKIDFLVNNEKTINIGCIFKYVNFVGPSRLPHPTSDISKVIKRFSSEYPLPNLIKNKLLKKYSYTIPKRAITISFPYATNG
nr:hypothetical protein [Abalone asfa-like virus]